jgi:hypothetical protein
VAVFCPGSYEMASCPRLTPRSSGMTRVRDVLTPQSAPWSLNLARSFEFFLAPNFCFPLERNYSPRRGGCSTRSNDGEGRGRFDLRGLAPTFIRVVRQWGWGVRSKPGEELGRVDCHERRRPACRWENISAQTCRFARTRQRGFPCRHAPWWALPVVCRGGRRIGCSAAASQQGRIW